MPFFHSIAFAEVDPLDDGLREEIAAEQQETEAIGSLDDGVDESALADYWRGVEGDIAKDPEWFNFSKDGE